MNSNVRTLELTNADTEYSIQLSPALSNITFQCRTAFAVRFSATSGKVAGSTEPYATLKAGQAFNLKDRHPNASSFETWYFASSEAGVVVELIETVNA